MSEIGLDPFAYATHSLRRTKASLIYRRTKNLRAVQLLHGHTKLESTVRYLGIEVEDALEESPVVLGLDARGIGEGHSGRSTIHIGTYELGGERIDRDTRQIEY